jgi:nitroimidazol reductase NimA-like FMN-containing flavoprotein (pyridoxamine 5'-phosphate oxidase superfamily)
VAAIEGRTWLELLSPAECERLLREQEVGRIAVLVDGHPEIFPVNYVVGDEREIYFRCDRGTKLDAVNESTTVCFEIDGLDDKQKMGWSVLVVGPATHVRDTATLAQMRQLPLQPWTAEEKANVVRISPTKITGRRIRRPAKAT